MAQLTSLINVSTHQSFEQRQLKTELQGDGGSQDRPELFRIAGENQLAFAAGRKNA
jgi:hypothetical protein